MYINRHAMTENHMTDWEGVKIIDKGPKKGSHQQTETRAIMSYLTCTMTSFVISTEEVDSVTLDENLYR